MNPYNFVRLDVTNTRLPQRRKPTPHHKFVGVSGQIQGKITAETPLFVRDPRSKSEPLRFIHNKEGKQIIPATSLKGLIRSLVETIGPGCFLLFDGSYKERSWPTEPDYTRLLPSEFRRCNHPDKLCVACRMFGTLVGGRESATKQAFHHAGYVAFSDATLTQLVDHSAVYTPPLFKPRVYHKAWYLSADRQRIAGRKFYYHQPEPYYLKDRPATYRQHLKPVGVGTTFEFSVTFNNLNPQDELPLLLYALMLEPTMRHKLGYAKPAGLGTIQIELTELKLIDYATRYTNPTTTAPAPDPNSLIKNYVNSQTQTLQDLRHVWQWPPREPDAGYGYPTTHWFRENSQATIADSLNAPIQ